MTVYYLKSVELKHVRTDSMFGITLGNQSTDKRTGGEVREGIGTKEGERWDEAILGWGL